MTGITIGGAHPNTALLDIFVQASGQEDPDVLAREVAAVS